MDLKDIEKQLDEWQKKADKYYENYQIDGLKSQLQNFHKYDRLATIARKALTSNQDEIERATENFRAKVRTEIKNLIAVSYTKEQVAEILYRLLG